MFAADTDGTKMEFAAGVQKIGAINNRYTVYKNPYMLENLILCPQNLHSLFGLFQVCL